MSYRMIIADDEYMLIQLVKKLGRFDELGIQIIDECHDGEEACQSILKHHPDFVLTDIQMPVYDGLEIVEKVRQVYPDTLFVLISGYRVFEYARSAIQLNVVDYLLKPVNADQLNAVLERLCRLTDEKRQQANDEVVFHSMKDAERQQKCQSFWEMMQSDGHPVDPLILQPETLRERFGLVFQHSHFLCAILDCDLPFRVGMDERTFSEQIRPIADKWLTKHGDYSGYGRKTTYFLILNFTSTNARAVQSDLAGFVSDCKELHDVYGEFRIHLAVSEIMEKVSSIPSLIRQAQMALWGRFVQPGDQIVRYVNIRQLPHHDARELYSDSVLKSLGEGIRYIRQDQTDAAFASVISFAEKHPYIYPDTYQRIWETFHEAILQNAAEARREQLRLEMEKAFRSSRTIAELFRALQGIVRVCLELHRQILQGKDRQPVEKAEQFVRRNYMQNISLELAAEEAGVSPAHLSRIFKERMGEGFNEFLTRIRLEASKKLLSDSRDSIRDIAGAVGYADEKYFSKLFRKEFGIKPTEYRKLYG